MTRLTFDTNVLVYAADTDSDEKHVLAKSLVDRGRNVDVVLSMQCLAEFVDVVRRKRRMFVGDAVKFIDAWASVFAVSGADIASLRAACGAVEEHSLSFWDAMLWAVAESAGCDYILTEDFQDGRLLGRVRFVNPFPPSNHRLIDAILPPG